MECDHKGTVRLDKPKPDGRGGLIYNIPVNCGKCLNCKKNRINQWSLRLVQEHSDSCSAFFVTLTYDTEHVPITERGFMSLDKKGFQDFFKRLRYHDEKAENFLATNVHNLFTGAEHTGQKIKFYAAGEYGSKRKRPHYHIILFNIKDLESIRKAWSNNIGSEIDPVYIPLGGIDIQEVNSNTIEYVLKYMLKDGNQYRKGFDGKKEFSLMSKNIGKKKLLRNYQDIIKRISKRIICTPKKDIKYQYQNIIEI